MTNIFGTGAFHTQVGQTQEKPDLLDERTFLPYRLHGHDLEARTSQGDNDRGKSPPEPTSTMRPASSTSVTVSNDRESRKWRCSMPRGSRIAVTFTGDERRRSPKRPSFAIASSVTP